MGPFATGFFTGLIAGFIIVLCAWEYWLRDAIFNDYRAQLERERDV